MNEPSIIEKLEAMRDRLRAQLDGVNMCISLMQEGEAKELEEVPVMQNRLPFVGKITSPKSDTGVQSKLYIVPRAQLVEIMRKANEEQNLPAVRALAKFASLCVDKTISDLKDCGEIMIESGISHAKNWQNAMARCWQVSTKPGSPVRKVGTGKLKLIG